MKKNGRVRVVVTGMGTVNPLGKTLDEYWDGLIEGRSAARTVDGAYSTEKLATKFACEVPAFDPTQYMDRKTAQRMARFSQMAVAASGMALADSGIDLSKQQQLSDWGAEQLTDAQIAYAASDVLHLHALKDKLDVMLAREGRAELAAACFRFLPDRARLDLAGWGAEDIFAHS